MLLARKEFKDEASLSQRLENAVFKYCEIADFKIEGKQIDAIFFSCNFRNIDWYWGIFTLCVFIDTRFEKCTFRGANFAQCRFLNCDFIDCQFVVDNLNAPCRFEDSQWFDCKVSGCVGLPESAAKRAFE